ncbi:MAG: hypothetical protein IKN82_11020 [Treponema sp.]|nr:hypothetical protein [Treponema sp.]
MPKFNKAFAMAILCTSIVFGFAACGNSSNAPSMIYVVSGGGSQTGNGGSGGNEKGSQEETRVPAVPPASAGTVEIRGKEYDLVTFGSWPQTVKADGVTVDKNDSRKVGAFTYCKGNDGEWYVELKENAKKAGYKYSDGTDVAQSSADSFKWFKVEPIKWRALTTNYDGKKLLLAESILTNFLFYDIADASDSHISRTIDGKTVYTNNYKHSKIRAWLNGLSYQKRARSAHSQSTCDDYLNAGFFQTAFTAGERESIATTTIDNSKKSLWGSSPPANYHTYVCDNTSDKIFLLSEKETCNSDYGFGAEDASDSARIRMATDYAIANGEELILVDGCGGRWWKRSPSEWSGDCASCVQYDGEANYLVHVDNSGVGVVPALCLK